MTPEEPLCWIEGRIVPERAALLPVRDRAVQHGYALFETVRVARGRPFRLGAHLERLRGGAAALAIEPPEGPDAARIAAELCAAWGARDGALKVLLTGGDPPDLAPAWIATVGPPRPLPEGARERGVAVEVATGLPAVPSALSRLKTTSYAGRALVRRRARERGRFEALLLDPAGRLVEGAATNVFFVRGGARGPFLCTPEIASGALPGIARALAIELAHARGIAVREGPFALDDLLAAEEAFLTNALVGVLPVREVDGAPLPEAPGPVARALAEAFDVLVAAECGGVP